MKRYWVAYLAIGILFGVFDFVYLDVLFKSSWQQVFGWSLPGQVVQWIRFYVLNIGIWLVPVVPVALYESRLSRSRLRSAVASFSVWCAAIVAYYFTNAAQLAIWGLPSRQEMHISNRGSAHFWENWLGVFQGDILGGIMEWIPIAVVGGAVVGFLTSSIYLRCNGYPEARSPQLRH